MENQGLIRKPICTVGFNMKLSASAIIKKVYGAANRKQQALSPTTLFSFTILKDNGVYDDECRQANACNVAFMLDEAP
ncbi:hypothetical protein PVK06_019764 [Gossypium arboreum]|uniref:Uncharacterized protein n=1 Tax=Gossypium arboreum TaxID=29729 RepID=A0ABR0PL13_GOSAR|nr:hypothetical protein PVK06_019764 [Gossypium arboreum]